MLYGVSFLDLSVRRDRGRDRGGGGRGGWREHEKLGAGGVAALARRFSLGRYRSVLANPAVWLLAPTWIAVNAFIGAWTSQSIFQLVNEPRPGFEDQLS